jgi:diaminopimelate epimerase
MKIISLSKDQIIKISNRNNIGCDQVIFINKDKDNNIFLKFFNSDGGEISACGNGSRCAAYFLMKEAKSQKMLMFTKAGSLEATLSNNNLVTINMGKPNFEWNRIPLSKKMDNTDLKIKINNIDGKEFNGGFALSIGNPHVIFFVEDYNQFNLKEIGPKVENHEYFPEKCNVTLASVKSTNSIKIKVWERGAGLTKACGTAACAVAVSSAASKKTGRNVDIEFPQGILNIEWRDDNNVYMKGKVSEIKKIIVTI